MIVSLINRFCQWVSHRKDAHWRRRSLRLRKKQNIARVKAGLKPPLPMHLERQRRAVECPCQWASCTKCTYIREEIDRAIVEGTGGYHAQDGTPD